MKTIQLILAWSALAGCMQSVPEAKPVTTSQTATSSATAGLSCNELGLRNGRIVARLSAIEQESKATGRTNAITNAALNIGIGALIGRSVGGGVDAIRAASTIGNGMSAVLAAERGQAQMGTVSDTLALARRSSELQRAIIERGC